MTYYFWCAGIAVFVVGLFHSSMYNSGQHEIASSTCLHYVLNDFMPVTEGLGSSLSILNVGLQLGQLYNLTFIPMPLTMSHGLHSDTETFFEFLQKDNSASRHDMNIEDLQELLEDPNLELKDFATSAIDLDLLLKQERNPTMNQILELAIRSGTHPDILQHVSDPGYLKYSGYELAPKLWVASANRDLHHNWNTGLYFGKTGDWFRQRYWASRMRQQRYDLEATASTGDDTSDSILRDTKRAIGSKLPAELPAKQPRFIVRVHYRAGDVGPGHPRYLPLSAPISTVHSVLETVEKYCVQSQNHHVPDVYANIQNQDSPRAQTVCGRKLSLELLTEGQGNMFKEWMLAFPNAVLRLGTPRTVLKDFDALVSADIVIGSRSSFSHWAMLFSDGIKVAPGSWLCPPTTSTTTEQSIPHPDTHSTRSRSTRECVEQWIFQDIPGLLLTDNKHAVAESKLLEMLAVH